VYSATHPHRRTNEVGLRKKLDPSSHHNSGRSRQQLKNFAHVALPVLVGGKATRDVLKYDSKAERFFNQNRCESVRNN
jgi:hypothetical protein